MYSSDEHVASEVHQTFSAHHLLCLLVSGSLRLWYPRDLGCSSIVRSGYRNRGRGTRWSDRLVQQSGIYRTTSINTPGSRFREAVRLHGGESCSVTPACFPPGPGTQSNAVICRRYESSRVLDNYSWFVHRKDTVHLVFHPILWLSFTHLLTCNPTSKPKAVVTSTFTLQ